MYIEESFTKFTNTKWDALKLSGLKRNVGEKLWFLHQYCILTNREPELLKMVEEIIENNVEFSYSKRKVRLSKSYCYGWEGTIYVSSINITDEQYEDIKTWYKRIRARKDSVIVDENTDTNNKKV